MRGAPHAVPSDPHPPSLRGHAGEPREGASGRSTAKTRFSAMLTSASMTMMPASEYTAHRPHSQRASPSARMAPHEIPSSEITRQGNGHPGPSACWTKTMGPGAEEQFLEPAQHLPPFAMKVSRHARGPDVERSPRRGLRAPDARSGVVRASAVDVPARRV